MRRPSLIAGAVGGILCAVAVAAPARADDLTLPPGPNRDLVYGQCRTCHDLQYLIESAGVPRDTWNDLLDSMKQYGLRIPPEQRAKILDYLGTYLGPNPPPATPAQATAGPAKVDGSAVFHEQCVACHQAQAQGVPGQFPPLAGNGDLFLSRDFPARVVLFGLSGKIKVKDQQIDSTMPPLDFLSDDQIAAVVEYVRGSFGNAALRPKDMTPLDAATVAKLRADTKAPSDEVYRERDKLKRAAAKR
jgi:mono/diheme cytochrome c family protein